MIGSSAISFSGFTGNPGAYGARGPTGNTGNDRVEECGVLSRGNTAPHITSITQTAVSNDYGHFNITYSNNNVENIDASVFVGNKLFDAYGISSAATSTSYISLLKNISYSGTIGSGSTATFNFKWLTSSVDGITITPGITFISIDSPNNTQSSIGISQGSLVYFKSNTELSGITTDMRFTGGILHTNIPGGSGPYVTRLITNNIINNIQKQVHFFSGFSGASGSTAGENSGCILDVSKAGVFYINTPNGIMGFTGFSGASGSTGEIRSLTLIIQNDSIWNFPNNVWFRPGEANLSCGENILNLITEDNGAVWKANFFGKGYGASPGDCLPSQILGSCSKNMEYCSKSAGDLCIEYKNFVVCEDYITKEFCDSIGATFCIYGICNRTNLELQEIGACCINGICRDNISRYLCEKHGGRHWSVEVTNNRGCSKIDCWDPCFGFGDLDGYMGKNNDGGYKGGGGGDGFEGLGGGGFGGGFGFGGGGGGGGGFGGGGG